MSSETLTIESPILNRNERLAAGLRERFRAAGTYVVNVLSSPGLFLHRIDFLAVNWSQLNLNGRAVDDVIFP